MKMEDYVSPELLEKFEFYNYSQFPFVFPEYRLG